MSIDCTEINPNEFLKALWDNSHTAAFFTCCNVPPPPYEPPKTGEKYFDYHCGRVIKCNFEAFYDKSKRVNGRVMICPLGYDRDNGNGSFARVVTGLRSAASNGEACVNE